MITEDTGQGELTSLGRFAGALPLDLRLGMLIHYGIALGECLISCCDVISIFYFRVDFENEYILFEIYCII